MTVTPRPTRSATPTQNGRYSVNDSMSSSEHHYEEFLPGGSVECPTCRGLGRIRKGRKQLEVELRLRTSEFGFISSSTPFRFTFRLRVQRVAQTKSDYSLQVTQCLLSFSVCLLNRLVLQCVLLTVELYVCQYVVCVSFKVDDHPTVPICFTRLE